MSGTGVKTSQESSDPHAHNNVVLEDRVWHRELQSRVVLLRLLWDHRRQLLRSCVIGFLLSTLVAFLIPKSYTSTAQLMPPDTQSSPTLAMMTALAGKGTTSLAGLSDLIGLKSSGALFIGVLRSQTSQDRIVEQFDLQKVYGTRLVVDARRHLDRNTEVLEDRKSGIISISVTDRSAERAAAMANAYVDELNSLITQLSTSAAHRERVFLEERLKAAKVDLDDATNQLAQFSSKHNTLDIQNEGKAMLEAASTLTGELIAAQSQLQGLREIYTDNNPRVRALAGRVTELRRQLQKFGGAGDSSQTDSPNLSNPSAAGGDLSASSVTGSPFPTIRNLPLLGATYSDYYRNAKIQETVYELLTEQFELAKVQEAKDTPSVKILDPGRVPETKSFPPRLLVILLGTVLAIIVASVWTVAARNWLEIASDDPRKVLALEVAATVHSHIPWASRNGDALDRWPRKIWSRLRGGAGPNDSAPPDQK